MTVVVTRVAEEPYPIVYVKVALETLVVIDSDTKVLTPVPNGTAFIDSDAKALTPVPNGMEFIGIGETMTVDT